MFTFFFFVFDLKINRLATGRPVHRLRARRAKATVPAGVFAGMHGAAGLESTGSQGTLYPAFVHDGQLADDQPPIVDPRRPLFYNYLRRQVHSLF